MGRLFLLSGFVLLVLLNAGIVNAQDTGNKIQFSAAYGYQQENFHWSIAGNINGQSPNVYSELKWKAVGGPHYDLALQWNVWNRLLLSGGYNRTFTTSGTSNDTDYGSDNRNNPVYNQNFSSGKGGNSAWFAGAGYQVIKSKAITIAPFIGYGINYQTYYLLGSNGNFNNLNTSYKTNWRGPFLKLRSAFAVVNRLKLMADVTYSQVNYDAQADWNLIENFRHPVSFRHNAKGYGFDADAKLGFDITRYLSVNIGGAYFNWETGTGTDQLYLTSGETDKTQLNGVARNGFRLVSGLSFTF